jgi:hypothetical protein
VSAWSMARGRRPQSGQGSFSGAEECTSGLRSIYTECEHDPRIDVAESVAEWVIIANRSAGSRTALVQAYLPLYKRCGGGAGSREYLFTRDYACPRAPDDGGAGHRWLCAIRPWWSHIVVHDDPLMQFFGGDGGANPWVALRPGTVLPSRVRKGKLRTMRRFLRGIDFFWS